MQIRRTASIPANSTTQNLLQGESIEFASEDSLLTLAATVIGTSAGNIQLTLRLTDEIVMDRAAVGGEGVSGAGPQLPYNVLKSRQPVGRGDHLILSATNITASAIVLTYLIEVEAI